MRDHQVLSFGRGAGDGLIVQRADGAHVDDLHTATLFGGHLGGRQRHRDQRAIGRQGGVSAFAQHLGGEGGSGAGLAVSTSPLSQ